MATLPQQLTDLKDFILRYNTYFDNGYDNVFQDTITGKIHNGKEVIFPTSSKGNFFYLRMPDLLKPIYANEYNIADNYQSIGVQYTIVLVASVIEADPQKLLQNMIATLGNYTENISMTGLMYDSDVILNRELSKIPVKDRKAAFQKNVPTLCSIQFNFTVPFVFQSLNCITNPCSTC